MNAKIDGRFTVYDYFYPQLAVEGTIGFQKKYCVYLQNFSTIITNLAVLKCQIKFIHVLFLALFRVELTPHQGERQK